MKPSLRLKYYVGIDARLPAESAKIVIEGDCLSINEDVHSSPARLMNGRSLQKE